MYTCLLYHTLDTSTHHSPPLQFYTTSKNTTITKNTDATIPGCPSEVFRHCQSKLLSVPQRFPVLVCVGLQPGHKCHCQSIILILSSSPNGKRNVISTFLLSNSSCLLLWRISILRLIINWKIISRSKFSKKPHRQFMLL